jgi:hypothetical protein
MLHSLLKFHALLETMYMIVLSNLKKVGKICVGYPPYRWHVGGATCAFTNYSYASQLLGML